MSPSPRSKAASTDSPATGSEAEAKDSDDSGQPSGPIQIELEVSRQRALSWTVFGILFGALLIWKLGTVGVWVGILLVVLGLFRAWELAQTFLHTPGTISVTDREVTLPRGLCMGKPLVIKPTDVTAVYFLRRSVPWNRSAPVLVVEVGSRALAFPRDWFATETDQRHIVHALLRNLGEDQANNAGAAIDQAAKFAYAQLGGGLALMTIGMVMWTMASLPISGSQYALYVTPIITGWIFAWRGFMRW